MEVKEKSQRNKLNWFKTLKGISIVYFNYLDFVLDNNYWFIIDLFINSLDINCLTITSWDCFVIKLLLSKRYFFLQTSISWPFVVWTMIYWMNWKSIVMISYLFSLFSDRQTSTMTQLQTVTINGNNNSSSGSLSNLNGQNILSTKNNKMKTRIIRLHRDGNSPLGFSIRGGEKLMLGYIIYINNIVYIVYFVYIH